MRRDHHSRHEHEDLLVTDLDVQYGGRVAAGLIEGRVAALHRGGQDQLSAECLARAEVASLAAAGPRPSRRGRR